MGVYDKLSSQKNSLSLEHEDERDGLLQPTVQFQRSNKLNKILCISSVLFLIVIVIQDGLSYARNKIRPAHVPTRFWNGDEEEEDASWKAIEAGHGLVSVTPEWAADRNLPDSLIHPRDPTKRVYVIEAYHSIHCLQTLRRHYMNLRRGEIPDRPMEHDLHCFDSLRQSVMCQANDELLYTTGHNDAGINQTRTCRDWDALREWASGFTSCYHDYVAPPGETKWGKCDNGKDGLPYGSLLS